MKIILVPTDFSTQANNAVEVAASIARKANGRLVLLHVVEEPGRESFNVEAQVMEGKGWEEKRFTLKLLEKANHQLDSMIDKLQGQGISASKALRLGNAFHGILSIIMEQEADLVVMGTSGHTKLEGLLVGSNTEKVVRLAKCPVLTIHNKPTNLEFKNIVFATSLNDNEIEFGSVIRNAQELYNATVHVVRINTPMNFQADHTVRPVMDDFISKLKLKSYTVNICNDNTEELGILHFAESVKADLIAMATHGRTGFAHVLVGSIAEDVVQHSTTPVLTFVTPRLYA